MDNLIGSDRFPAVVGATLGKSICERRLGKRVYETQGLYRETVMNQRSDVLKHLKGIANYAENHFTEEATMSEESGGIVRLPIRNGFQGNKQAYDLVNELLKVPTSDKKKELSFSKEKEVWDKCFISGTKRSGAKFSYGEEVKRLKKFSDISSSLALFSSLEIYMDDLAYKRVGEHNNSLKKYKKEKSPGLVHLFTSRDKAIVKCGIDMFVLGDLRIVYVREKAFVLSSVHYERAMKLLSGLRRLILAARDVPLRVDVGELPILVFKTFYNVAKDDCNFVGEVGKAARQILFLGLEKSDIMGKAVDLYRDAINPDRAARASAMAETFSILTEDRLVAVNLAGVYSVLPHPDPCLSEMFHTIDGIKEPNKVIKHVMARLEGCLRRNLFLSMRKSGHDVRLTSKDMVGDKLAELSEDVTQSTATMSSYSSTAWSSTSFQKVRSLVSTTDMSVPVASKASSAGILMTINEEQEAMAYFAGYGDSVPDKLMGPTTVNDASEEIGGRSKMGFDKALKRFEKVISLHEKFEARFHDLEIDDIPSEELEKFLEENPMASYIVGTEGKFGEVHKRITRLFYIGEQQLKTLTQRIERLAKQVTRNQAGVSIVKSYIGRREDLQNSVHAVSGRQGKQRSIAVSFDMSEFSKKFALVLVRMYGGILSELTGEDYLKRADLFFRASKVMYSNRGYYDHLRGAKGGFEGFLNFVWSSIHAGIMEVALEAVGVKGQLLTFSDDGLLIFYPSSEMSDLEIEKLIEKIRDVYDQLGLKFHLGKTLVSDHMWEYLGDVCYNRKLIPMWIKELVKMGNLVFSRGYTPLYDKIKAIDAQGGAMVVSSGDPLTAYIMKRYECHRVIRNYLPEANHLLEEVLLNIPTSCGGFRIKSPFEDSCYLTIEGSSEVYADMVLLDSYEKGTYAKVTSAILSRIHKFRENHNDIKSLLTTFSIFKTSIPDTSGNSQLHRLLDKVKMSSGYRVPRDPLDRHTCRDIYDILSTARKVDPMVVQNLISNMPGMSEYNDFLGILKGSGALKLARRKDIAAAQSSDTKTCRKAINFWYNALFKSQPSARIDFLSRCFDFSYPYLDVRPMRTSPRLALQAVPKGKMSMIEICYQGSNDPNIYSSSYTEPILKFPVDPTTLGWHSEATGDKGSRDTRKFLSTVSRILSHYPNSEKVVRGICDVLGLKPPQVPAGLVRGIQRHRGGVKRAYDARLILPRYHMYFIQSRFVGPLSQFMSRNITADRTTYLVAAEVLSYFYYTDDYELKGKQNGANEFYYFTMRPEDVQFNFMPEPMEDTNDTPDPGPETNLPPAIMNEYNNSTAENIRYQEHVINLSAAVEFENQVGDEMTGMVVDGFISLVHQYLVSVSNQLTSTILSEIEMPNIGNLRTFVLRRAVVSAAYTIMNPQSRTELSGLLNNNRVRPSHELLVLNGHYRAFLDILLQLRSLLPPNILSMTRNFTADSIVNPDHEMMNVFVSTFFDSTIFSERNMTVFFSKTYSEDTFSNDHRVAYRKVFRESVRTIFTAYAKVGWRQDLIAEELPRIANMDVDEQIDCLKCLNPIIRASTHRSSPYNSRSSLIELKKFYYLVSKMYRQARTSANREQIMPTKENLLERYGRDQFTDNDGAEIRNIVAIVGEDHVANSTRDFPTTVTNRVIWYVLRMWREGEDERPAAIRANGSIDNAVVNQIQTAFNETVLTVVRRKVKAYHYNIGMALRREFINIARNHGVVAGIQTDVDGVVGHDLMPMDNDPEVEVLLINHLEILKYQNGLLGFRSPVNMVHNVQHAVDVQYQMQGDRSVPEVALMHQNLGEDANYYTCFKIRCDNLSKALTSYMHLCSSGRGSASIVKVEEAPLEEVLGLEEGDNMDALEENIEEYQEDISSREGSRGNSEVGVEANYEVLSEASGGSIYEDYEEEDNQGEEDPVVDEGLASKRYDVVGVTSLRFNERMLLPEAEPNVRSNISDVLGELVDNLTLGDSVRETNSIISSITTSSHRRAGYRSTGYLVTQHTSHFSPGRQLNKNSSLLQAAVYLSREHMGAQSQFAAYACLMAYMRNARSAEDIQAVIREISPVMRNQNIRSDVSYCCNWLRSSDIVAGPEVRDNRIARIKRAVLLVFQNVGFDMPIVQSNSMMRSFRDARSEAFQLENLALGELQNVLYYDFEGEDLALANVADDLDEDLFNDDGDY